MYSAVGLRNHSYSFNGERDGNGKRDQREEEGREEKEITLNNQTNQTSKKQSKTQMIQEDRERSGKRGN